jgi:hypothetical protein
MEVQKVKEVGRFGSALVSPRGGFGMQARIVSFFSTVAELGVFAAAALALVMGLNGLR